MADPLAPATVPTNGNGSDPVAKAKINGPVDGSMSEVGISGLSHSSGYLTEEFVRELMGPRGRRVFREMADNDPVIGAILFSVDMLMRQVEWKVDPHPDDPDDEEGYAEFIESAINDMDEPWVNTVSSILSMLTYGWSLHEIVYKKREGDHPNTPTRDSKHNDGKIGWRKFAPRSQDTLAKWEFEKHEDGTESDRIVGMWQSAPPSWKNVLIPLSKALLFRTTTSVKNSPEGRSVLRNAYRAWYFKRRIEEIEAIGIERDLAGLPVAWVPYTMLSDQATAAETASLNEIKAIVRRIKRDEQEGVVFPMAYDPESGNKLFDLTLLQSSGRRQFDTGAIVTRYDQRIAMTVLADFILLGHEKLGSFALGSSKIDLFTGAIEAWLRMIAAEINNAAIPRLLTLNGMDVNKAPVLVHGTVKSVDLAGLGDYISKLAGAQMPLFPNARLEQHVLEIAGLPYAPDEMDEDLDVQHLGDLPLPQSGNPESAVAAKISRPEDAAKTTPEPKPATKPVKPVASRQVAGQTSYAPADRPPGSH